MEDKARAAITAWCAWMIADGCFPEPEYDRFMDAMHELAVAIGIDMMELDRQLRVASGLE